MTEEIKDEAKEQENVEAKPDDVKQTEAKSGTEGLSKREAQEVEEGEAAPKYIPPQQKRKRRKKNKPPVGVGGLLDYARIKFSHGEYAVDEDENGQYRIGEAELTFDNWGQMIRTKDDGVYTTHMAIPRQKMRKPRMIYDVDTKANGGATKKKKTEQKDKDEGELSDSPESDVSSSSDSDAGTYHRKRQKKRKTTSDNMDAKEIFAKAYQYRNHVVQSLNLQQKMTLLELLTNRSYIS